MSTRILNQKQVNMDNEAEVNNSMNTDVKDIKDSSINKGNEGKVRMRRFHTKSRNGCFSCKKLRIKCDENKPACRYCSTRKKTCVYPNRTGTNTIRKQQFIELEFFSSANNSNNINIQEVPETPILATSRRSSSALTPSVHEFPRPTLDLVAQQKSTNLILLNNDSQRISIANKAPVYKTIQNTPSVYDQDGLSYNDILCFFKEHAAVILCQNNPAQLYLWTEIVPQLAVNEPLLSNCIIAYTALLMKLGRTGGTNYNVETINSKLKELDSSPKPATSDENENESSKDTKPDSTIKKLDEIAYTTYSKVLRGLSAVMENVSSSNALSMYFSGVLIAAFSISESPPVSLSTIKGSENCDYNKLDPLPDMFEILRGTHDFSTLVYPYISDYWHLISPVFPFELSQRFTLDSILAIDLMADKRLLYFLPIFQQIAHMENGNRSLCSFIKGDTISLQPDTVSVINKLVRRAFDDNEFLGLPEENGVFGIVSGELESATVMTFLLIHYFLKAISDNNPTVLWFIFRDASTKYLELLRQNRQLEIIILAFVCGLFESTQFIPGPTFIRNFNITIDHVSPEWRPALYWPLKFINMVAESNFDDPWFSAINLNRENHKKMLQ